MAAVFDSHTHSMHSADGFDAPGAIAAAASAGSLAGFCLTDHCDLELWNQQDFPAVFQKGYREILRLRGQYEPRLLLCFGIELGQPLRDEARGLEMLALLPYDYVLLSEHSAQGLPDLFELDYAKMSGAEIHDVAERYFAQVEADVRIWPDYDALAHLTLPARYLKRRTGITLDLKRYGDRIEAILKILAQRGKGLEINMSGMRSSHGDSMPSPWIVRLFRELGGEIITVGSDTHRAETVGAFVDEGMKIAYEAGFQHTAYFRERKPVFVRLQD